MARKGAPIAAGWAVPFVTRTNTEVVVGVATFAIAPRPLRADAGAEGVVPVRPATGPRKSIVAENLTVGVAQQGRPASLATPSVQLPAAARPPVRWVRSAPEAGRAGTTGLRAARPTVGASGLRKLPA